MMSFALWLFLPVGAVILLTLVGRLAVLEQDIRDQAERAASKQFERFGAERGQALDSLRRSR